MKRKLKIFIIAGEVSGDALGGKIMHSIGARAEFSGIGGAVMKTAGLKSLFSISDLAVMGFLEVLANARTLSRRINETADEIIKTNPDIVLTIDSPGFAKRVVEKVRKNVGASAPKFYHVVAPQVWAWGAGRAKKYAKIFDKLYCFFDFEVPYFTKYGLNTIAVGHPIADGLCPSAKLTTNNEQLTTKNIALIPGSRISEVKKLLPLMKCAAEQICHKNPGVWWNFYIPVTETTEKYIREITADYCFKPEIVPYAARYETYDKTDIAIVASGTASAELAIMHVPAIVVYKMNPVTEFLARIALKTKWVSLVNILLKKTVYPELLGHFATPENILCE
ncbi:MAG: lipid-A-disaccharide synthase, partial [Alphaproteobacteria bacterium]|nr:lipid-A-disaccharide synthase [Alphaproteobacteria bacterium]